MMRLEKLKNKLREWIPGPVTIENRAAYQPLSQFDPKYDRDASINVVKSDQIIPYFLNPFNSCNAGIFWNFFNNGLANIFLTAPLTVYIVEELNISATEVSSFFLFIFLPYSLKFLPGLLTDSNPIFGYRRKSWIFIAWMIYVFCLLFAACLSHPNFYQLLFLLFTANYAHLSTEICAEAMVVERARHEMSALKGSFLGVMLNAKYLGSIIGAILSAILYNYANWGWGLSISQLFLLQVLIPAITVSPWFWQMEEVSSPFVLLNIAENWTRLWDTFQLNAVWHPMIFFCVFSLFQIPNQSWNNFLVKGLDFSDFDLGLLAIAGTVFTLIGVLLYERYLYSHTWGSIITVIIFLNLLFGMGQLILVLRLNTIVGIPNILFAVGDTAGLGIVHALTAMPVYKLVMRLCPEGSEGVTFALLATLINLAENVAGQIGVLLTFIWNVSNNELENGNYSGVRNLTLLTSVLQLLPLLLIPFVLPKTMEAQEALLSSQERNIRGGLALMIITIVFYMFVFISTLYFISILL